MEPFANLHDAGGQLGGLVRRFLLEDPDAAPLCLAPIMPNGVPVLDGMRPALPDHVIVPLSVTRSAHGIVIDPPDDVELAGYRIIVVDDGVETGTAARAAHEAVRAFHPAEVVLAVPVCPRQTMAELALRFDDIIAVQTPLGRRDLRWHYADFDTVDDDEAWRMLSELT